MARLLAMAQRGET